MALYRRRIRRVRSRRRRCPHHCIRARSEPAVCREGREAGRGAGAFEGAHVSGASWTLSLAAKARASLWRTRFGAEGRRDRRRRHPGGDACRSIRRSEEHTSELQSLMRISYAVFCLKKKKYKYIKEHNRT